ncbi:MAG: enoyl-CoA hydratase/isomerase family protein, partial [Proteobacteria bacterium]|nr:enoyl-CoA hydratase/isomerase family protein [Pseudomonadota bacterium]
FSLAYPAIGASCDCGTSWSLPRLLGVRRALELALLGETVNAEQAHCLGMVSAVVPVDQLDATVETMLQQLASGPTVAYGHLKRLMRSSLESGLPAQLAKEAAAFQACASTADFGEGAAAFLGKRDAQFMGA